MTALPSSALRPEAAVIIRATVMHHRFFPRPHRFVYPVFCVRLNMDKVHTLESFWFGINRHRLLSLRFSDYGDRSGANPSSWVRRAVASAGVTGISQVWLQTFPRLFGYVFNPVSFWFCHDAQGALVALVAEVNNTFGDHHVYVLTAPVAGSPIDDRTALHCRKTFHVSPFLAVRGDYRFRVRNTPTTTFVGIDHFDERGLVLKTSIGGRVTPWRTSALLGNVLRFPFMTLGVILRIHWQALRLWLKRVPFFGVHPPAEAVTHKPPEPELSPRTTTTRPSTPEARP